MKTWYWVVIAGGIFILGLVLGKIFLGVESITDEYIIFRDIFTLVLSIFGIGIALLGAAIYKIISQNLESEIKKKMKEVDISVKKSIGKEINVVLCKFYVKLSYTYWKLYEPENYKIEDEIELSLKRYLEMAITQSEWGMKCAEQLDEKKFESLVCLVKNNLAYHLSMRGFADDSSRAISLAKYAYNKIWNYDYKQTCFWTETYAFVLMKLGDRQQKKEGINLIKGLLTRKDLDGAFKQYIDNKYRKFL